MDNFDGAMAVWDVLRETKLASSITSTPIGAVGDKGRLYTVDVCASHMSGRELTDLLKTVEAHDLSMSIDIRGQDAWLVLS